MLELPDGMPSMSAASIAEALEAGIVAVLHNEDDIVVAGGETH